MKPLHQLIFLAALTFCCLSCKNESDIKEDSIEIKEVILTATSQRQIIAPPPPGFTSKFKTLNEWLFHICKSEKRKQDSLTYDFRIYKTLDSTSKPTDECLLSLVGTATYNNSPDHSITKIKFKPKENFVQLPKEDCENLTIEQIQTRIIKQLKKFTGTEKFKHSFFQSAKEITVNGRKIWPE